MKSKAALDALTDQAIAVLADAQRNDDEVTAVQVAVAADLAAMLAVQFGDDAPLAGRVAVASGQALAQLIRDMRGEIPDYNLAPIMANLLAFAGEQLIHGSTP